MKIESEEGDSKNYITSNLLYNIFEVISIQNLFHVSIETSRKNIFPEGSCT